jgi:hypothetical protein
MISREQQHWEAIYNKKAPVQVGRDREQEFVYCCCRLPG